MEARNGTIRSKICGSSWMSPCSSIQILIMFRIRNCFGSKYFSIQWLNSVGLMVDGSGMSKRSINREKTSFGVANVLKDIMKICRNLISCGDPDKPTTSMTSDAVGQLRLLTFKIRGQFLHEGMQCACRNGTIFSRLEFIRGVMCFCGRLLAAKMLRRIECLIR